MIREEIWWPDDLDPRGEEFVTEGDGRKHIRNDETYAADDHLYTFKQTRNEVIWACACGRTLVRYKP